MHDTTVLLSQPHHERYVHRYRTQIYAWSFACNHMRGCTYIIHMEYDDGDIYLRAQNLPMHKHWIRLRMLKT